MKKALTVCAGVFLTILLFSAGVENAGRQGVSRQVPSAGTLQGVKIETDFGKMPLYFIPNKGQVDKQVAYYVQGKDKTIYFTPGGITLALTVPAPKENLLSTPGMGGLSRDLFQDEIKPQQAGSNGENAGPGHGEEASPEGSRGGAAERWVVKLEFVGADQDVKPVGEAETGAIVSYFKGKPEKWRTGLPTYSKIVYPNLWPGIDLAYCGTVNRLKYEFIVHPGADPSNIRLAYQGAESVAIDRNGRLQVKTPAGHISDDVPIAYQEGAGERRPVSLSYAFADESETDKCWVCSDREPAAKVRTLGFAVGVYDHSQTLVLDPAFLIYCGYIGGSGTDTAQGIAVDGAGNAYVTGYSDSSEATFPVTVGPDLTLNNEALVFDAFVAKVNASGTALIYCGYIGGSSYDWGNAIAVDAAGNAYVTGTTSSTEATFPVTIGPDLTFNGIGTNPGADAFIAKINAMGTALVYCGYVGGFEGNDIGNGIAVDRTGNAYVIGETGSNLPVIVGPDLSYNGGRDDAFVAKVNAAGTAFLYCGYIGGADSDYGFGIAVDSAGNAYVTGGTSSSEATFPVTVGPGLVRKWAPDAFVAKINAAGTALPYCGYIGGASTDDGYGIAVDGTGNAYVTGYTYSDETTFPVMVGPDLTFNNPYGYTDAFVAKVNTAGTALTYCGYVGGAANDRGLGIAVDSAGNAYVVGTTASTEATFPVRVGPDLTYNGAYSSSGGDAFVAKVNSPGAKLIYCGYVGGGSDDWGSGIAVGGSGQAFIAGGTRSNETTFPVKEGPDLSQNGQGDTMVAKISYWDDWAPKWATGDFDGDGTNEATVDFGATGAWIWDSGTWTVLTALNPEGMLAADVNGDGVEEILLSFGPSGLWIVVGGVGNGISTKNAENMAAGDTDADGADEVVCDFGPDGLWFFDGGTWTQLSGVNADYVTTANVDGSGGAEIIGDFEATGLWLWNTGVWTQLSGVNADYMASGRAAGITYLVGDFEATGLWGWSIAGGWTQLSGVNADYMITANADGDTDDEIVGDFGTIGLWMCDGGIWTQWSGVNAEYVIAADIDGNGSREIATDFGTLGLWLWNAGSWSQISGVNAEYHLAADLDGDNKDEILADFGSLGLWLWNEGAWSQISANNPD